MLIKNTVFILNPNFLNPLLIKKIVNKEKLSSLLYAFVLSLLTIYIFYDETVKNNKLNEN